VVYLLYEASKLSRKSNTKGVSAFQFLTHITDTPGVVHEFIERTNTRKGFYHLWLGTRFTVIACDPDAAKFVLKHPQIEKSRILGSLISRTIFGNNVLNTNGEEWRQQRHLVNFGFKGPAYQSYFPTFLELMDKLLNKLESHLSTDIEISLWHSKMTIDILGKSIFNYDFRNLDSTQNVYYDAYKVVLNQAGPTHRMLSTVFPYIDYLPLPTSIKLRKKC